MASAVSATVLAAPMPRCAKVSELLLDAAAQMGRGVARVSAAQGSRSSPDHGKGYPLRAPIQGGLKRCRTKIERLTAC
jgi:hypothetical protein